MHEVLYTPVLWCYAVMASVVFGASLYETLVVHPAWSRRPPESFVAFVGAPVGRMDIGAFWMPVAPLFALGGMAALAMAAGAGRARLPIVMSSACAVAGVAWTLVYFRPTIVRFLERGGGPVSANELPAQVRQWIVLNWIRVAMVAVAWWGAIATLATPG